MKRRLLGVALVAWLAVGLLTGPTLALVVKGTYVDWHIFTGDSANSIYTIADEPADFSDVTLFCPLDSMDTTNNVTVCFHNGIPINASIGFNSTTGYPKLVSGRIGNAFEFSGRGEYVSTGVVPEHNISITLAAWIRVENTPSYFQYVVQHAWGATSIVVKKSNPAVFRFNVNGAYVESQKQITFGKWYFVVAEYNYDTGAATLYVYDASGNLLDKVSQNIGQVDIVYSDTKPWTINYGGFDQNLTIDEVRIYYRVLTDDEIKLLLLAGRKKLSEPANLTIVSTAYDSTAKEFTITVNASLPAGAQYIYIPASATTSAPVVQNWSNGDKLVNVNGLSSVLINFTAPLGGALEGVKGLAIWTDEGLYAYGAGSMTIAPQTRLVDGVKNTISTGQVTTLTWDDSVLTKHPLSGLLSVSAGDGVVTPLKDTQNYIKLDTTVVNPIKLNFDNLAPLTDYTVLLNGDKKGNFKTDDIGSATYTIDSAGTWEFGLPADVYASFAGNLTNYAVVAGIIFIIIGWVVEQTPSRWDDDVAKVLFALGAIALAMAVIRLILFML